MDGQQVLAGARARHLNHELQRSSTFYKMEADHAAASEERHALKQLAEQQAAALAASESEARGRNRKQAVLAQELAAERRLRLDAEAAVHEQDVREEGSALSALAAAYDGEGNESDGAAMLD